MNNTQLNPAQLINQTSGNTEIWTPLRVIRSAQWALGGIDLDPASCHEANYRRHTEGLPPTMRAPRCYQVAQRFYSKEQDALLLRWRARSVWMNHPFGEPERACVPNCTKKTCRQRGHHLSKDKPGNPDWINKLIDAYRAGLVGVACCITFASTSEGWFQPLYDFPQCWIHPRLNYVLPDGSIYRGVTKGSVITYLGSNVSRFRLYFGEYGRIK